MEQKPELKGGELHCGDREECPKQGRKEREETWSGRKTREAVTIITVVKPLMKKTGLQMKRGWSRPGGGGRKKR